MEADILKNNMYLPLSMIEAVYVRGALKSALKNMRQGDERDNVNNVVDRLNNMVLDLNSYATINNIF